VFIAERVQRRLDDAAGTGGAARVTRVDVAEDETLRVTFEPERDA
jgi:hypothetical protein